MMGAAVANRVKYFASYKIADIKRPTFKDYWIPCDFEDLDVDMGEYDLAINCAPSKFGYKIARYIVESGTNCVDMSFYEKDPFSLDELAKAKGCLYIPDAGFAPGLTNLVTGLKLKEYGGTMAAAYLALGGIAKSPFAPYGYSVTWSVEDLETEYKRPARYIYDHEVVKLDPFDSTDSFILKNTQLESFFSDGLRTLLRHKDKINTLMEYTLRWPGHMKAVEPLIEKGTFVETIKSQCSSMADTAIFDCRFFATTEWDEKADVIQFITHGDDHQSAMMKTTAGMCAIIASAVLEGMILEIGVKPLEDLATRKLFDFVVREFENKEGIFIEETKE